MNGRTEARVSQAVNEASGTSSPEPADQVFEMLCGLQSGVPGDHVEIPISMPHRYFVRNCDGGDQAVCRRAYRVALLTPQPIDAGCLLKDGAWQWIAEARDGEETVTKGLAGGTLAEPLENLLDNRPARDKQEQAVWRELAAQAAVDQLDPNRRIDENHRACERRLTAGRSSRICERSPCQRCLPKELDRV